MKKNICTLISIFFTLLTLFSCKKEEETNYYIVLRVPNGHERYQQGETIDITWNDNIDENVRIDLLCESEQSLCITSSTKSNGSFSWIIPNELENSEAYVIKISSVNNAEINDKSRYGFTISDVDNSNPYYVKVLEPNGGEIWTTGASVTCKWETNHTLVKIYLTKGGIIVGQVSGNGVTGDTFTGNLDNFAPGSDYKILIAKASDISFCDESDGYFTIKNPPEEE